MVIVERTPLQWHHWSFHQEEAFGSNPFSGSRDSVWRRAAQPSLHHTGDGKMSIMNKEGLIEMRREHEREVMKDKREDVQIAPEITQTGSWCQRQRKPHLCTR